MSRLTVTACYLGESDTPFVCAVNGPVTTGALNEIEGEIQSFEDAVWHDGPGDYTFSVTHQPAQYDDCGNCEFAAYWDLNLELFSSLETPPQNSDGAV